MKILIAPDKFKGSLSADDVSKNVAKKLVELIADIEIVILPLADGGEGFVDVLIGNKEIKKNEITVNDPINRWINSQYCIVENNTAIIEMANASGLHLLSKSERNPLKTSTLGTGQLIKDAIEKGAKEIIVGIGGSATNDAGMGMATAFGYRFFDKNDQMLVPSGENMIKVCKIVEPATRPWENINIKVACDVTNSLYGVNGAAYVFAKQKGANPQQIKELDRGLRQFSSVVNKHFGQDFHFNEGAGAAGGLGYGLMAFLNAKLMSGIDLILDVNDFDKKLTNVNYVITGEGKIDTQTLAGKVVSGVVQRAKIKGVPVIGICGVIDLDDGQINELGLLKIFSIKNKDISLEYAMENAAILLNDQAEEIAKFILNS